jgi:hypothetical protein
MLSGFKNDIYNNYKYNTSYKYWLVKHLDLHPDVNTLLMGMTNWMSREFNLPDITQFKQNHKGNDYYVNDNGIVFVKMKLIRNDKQNDKQVFYQVSTNGIINFEFYYSDDTQHYYTIDIHYSNIKKLTMIKQPFQVVRRYQQRYITTCNPIFIAK